MLALPFSALRLRPGFTLQIFKLTLNLNLSTRKLCLVWGILFGRRSSFLILR